MVTLEVQIHDKSDSQTNLISNNLSLSTTVYSFPLTVSLSPTSASGHFIVTPFVARYILSVVLVSVLPLLSSVLSEPLVSVPLFPSVPTPLELLPPVSA